MKIMIDRSGKNYDDNLPFLLSTVISYSFYSYNDTSVLQGVTDDDDDVVGVNTSEPSPPKKPRLSEEEDADLQLAIQMSLNDSSDAAKSADVPENATVAAQDDDEVSSNADSDFIDVPALEEVTGGSLWANDHKHTNVPFIQQSCISEPSIPDGTVDFRHADLMLNISADSQRKHLERCNVLEVVIQPDAKPDEDIFADVFTTTTDILKEMVDIDKTTSNKSSAPPLKETINEILNGLNKEMDTLAQVQIDSILPTISDEIIAINDDNEKVKMKQSSISSYITISAGSTPKKIIRPESPTPNIKSPFFRKKTPSSSSSTSSSKKKITDDNPPDSSKVAKVLFEVEEKAAAVHNLTAADVLDTAAEVLRTLKSKEDLTHMADVAQQQTAELRFEQNKQSRIGSTVTERMSAECKQLLRLFGVPYLVAPKEAEAQCAYLEAAHLTDGTITDDSDIWLFGGRTVYKYFFNQAKHVMEFRAENVEQAFNMERSKLIQMAMLVGSDYTTGIRGIGAVTALEILAAFKSTEVAGETTATQSLLSGLRKFKSWWQDGQRSVGSAASLRKKLKNIKFEDEFPSHLVVDAYMNPEVDRRDERFVWTAPDVESIREFAKQTFGWTRLRTDETLQPILRRLEEKKSQISIKNYFSKIGGGGAAREVSVSKRVRQAINKMGDDEHADEEQPKEVAAKRERKPRAKRVHENTLVENKIDIEKGDGRKRKIAQQDEPVASTSTKPGRVPNFCPPIKQREKAAEQMETNKQKAIELLAKSKKGSAKKK